MKDWEVGNTDTYVNFVELFKLADLEQVLLPHKDGEFYEALLRYYFACVGVMDSPRLLEPLRLFKQTLEPLLGNPRVRRDLEVQTPAAASEKHPPNLSQIYDKVEGFESRVQFGVEQMKIAATEVSKTLHFVWLGGGVGAIQRDYLNVWKQVLAGHGYTLNLWYDSDALLAHQTNKLIVEAAKADALSQVGDKVIAEDELARLYEERAIVLKQQMHAHINAAVAKGESADEARMDLLTRAYGQDAAELEALLQRNRRSVLEMAEGDLQLRDLDGAAVPLQLQDIYERETRLRGNLAAASDVVRVEVLYDEGGSYADVDNLPPLLKTLGGVDVSVLASDARLGILQLLLNHNPEWMPGRQAASTDYSTFIPSEHLPALEAFAKSRPALSQVFQPPTDRLARPFMLRAVAEGNSITNAFLMAHSRSATLQTVIERMRFNYDLIDATTRLAAQRSVALNDFAEMLPLAQEVLERTYGPLIELPNQEEIFAGFLASAAASYFSDGIRLQSEGTIYLTGPGAMRDGMADYAKAHLTPSVAETVREEAAIARYASVNRATEEELDHSWKDNATDPVDWVKDEQKRWQEGQYKTRYQGDIAQLLKGSTIEFEQGWPLIEGRAVLLTDVLQRLVDELGEPFIQAMRQGHDGAIVFEESLPLSFADRQAIKNQAAGARPSAFLSNARIQTLGLDEVLSGMAHGELHLVETSPLQRLSLGMLLGMDSLHSQNFANFTDELDNLANSVRELGTSSRYAVIERYLYKRKAPAFMGGLASDDDEPSAFSGSALDLKKAALMKAQTLHQWGRYVARIQQVATLEHRLQISERLDQVLGQFEASSVKLVPQDLLLNGDGETIGGRCYPLALMMSAALAQGEMASHRLRERFYLTAIEPGQSESVAFVQALEELRGTQLSEVGTLLSRADLEQVTAALENHGNTRTLMLNSDNHSMLVAKTVFGEHVLYHFYDPNFGLFEFENAAMFRRAMEHFFLKMGMARFYAAYGAEVRPMFDLIELQGERVSALPLSAGFDVARILTPDPLSGQAARSLRQRLNNAHGRSLVDNSHLGRSLLRLDSHWWGEQIAQATRQLQTRHQLSADAVPLFETLEVTPGGEYKISLVDPKAGQTMAHVTTDDHRILRIKEFLSGLFETLVSKQQSPVSEFDPTDAGSVHTLTAGFTIQALMNALRHHEGAASGGDNALTTAIRLHAYVNYAQLAHGNVVDVIGIVKLVRQALDDEKLIARTSAPLVQRALGHIANEGVGTVLGLVNVGFDIYQLSHATNDIEKAQFGTQLAFDSASVALAAAGLGAALAGASTVAAVLGGGGVILGGLTVGVAALAEGFATIAEEAKEVALFFDGLQKAYLQGGYHLDKASNAWIAHPSLVFADLDLHESTVHFDSPKLFPLRDHFGVPDYDVDYARATDIRQGLELPGSAPFSPQAGQTIVLPCTPKTWFGYEYKLLPFVTFRHAGGFDTARRLEKKNEQGQWQFLFSFYSFPGEYVVNRLYPVYKPTVFNVRLDNIERSLVVPALPKAWHGMVSYRIEGAGAQCSVLLNPGVSLELDAPSHIAMRWVLLAPWLAEADIRIEAAGRLVLNTLGVKFSGNGAHDVLLKLAGNKIMRVDLVALRLEVVEEDADPALGEQALLDHFKSLAREHRLAMPYTPVHGFVVPFEKPDEPRTVAAYYDSARDRFLYVRDPEVILADESVLGVVVEDFAYFYHPESFDVWQVDATTGTLVQRYRLLIPQGKATIIQCEVTAHGAVQVVQQVLRKDGQHDELTYMIHDRAVWLSSITLGLVPALQPALDADMLTDWKQVLGDYVLPRESTNTVNWRPGALVSICWQLDDKFRDLIWVRDSDGLIIRAPARRHHSRGWNDSIKALADLLLIAPAGVQGEVFVTFDKTDRRLVRQQRSIVDGRAQWTSSGFGPLEVKNVVAVEQGYLALTDSGLFFNVMPDGHLRLGGVTEAWLKDRPQWWSALATVETQYPVSSFAILGLTGLQGDAGLCAWYLDDRLLLAELGQGKEVRLLSITPDNQTVWLFDLSTGKIVRQGFIDPDRLDAAFAQGTKLLQAEALPAPQQEWASWTFVDVTVEGAGLRATTREGVELDLQHNEPARITGVDSRWVAALEGELRDGLAALANEHRCADFLCVKDADYLQWYVVRTGRLIRIPTIATDAQYSLVGTQKQTNVMLHAQADGFVHTYPQENKVGPFVYIQRNDEVLTVEGAKMGKNLLPLIADDVSILVLKMGQGSITSRLTRAAWLKLESVIVDCRYSLDHPPTVPGKLIWESVAVDQLWVNRVDEHLVIVDSDSGHSLIFRQVFAVDPALRGDVFLALDDYQSFAVSTLVSALLARKDTFNNVLLNKLVSVEKVEAIES